MFATSKDAWLPSKLTGRKTELTKLTGRKTELTKITGRKTELTKLTGRKTELTKLTGRKTELTKLTSRKIELTKLYICVYIVQSIPWRFTSSRCLTFFNPFMNFSILVK